MPAQSTLDDLLLQWEELHDQGREPDLDDLCAGCPELAEPLRRRIHALRAMAGVLVVAGDATSTDTANGPGNGARWSPAVTSVRSDHTYKVLHAHARGGLGEVVVASDDRLGREVAVKFVRPQHAGSLSSRQRFVREAETTGRLEHPGIVPVYSTGQDERGCPFYVMRFVRGDTLADAIARHWQSAPRDRFASVDFRQLLNRFVAVCNTIAYAHDRGFVHRDIKPANILLGPYGETLVADWGLAKSVNAARDPGREAASTSDEAASSDSTELTQAGQAIGTPAFMSPEQASGSPDAVTPASDIYSLGATLYVILTGQAPPIDPHLGLISPRPALRPRRQAPAVPTVLDAICRHATAGYPPERYATALELAADVERWLADEPVSVYRDSWITRLRRFFRRHRTLAASSVLAGLLVLAFVAVLSIVLNRKNVELGRALEAETQSKEHARRVLDAQTSFVLEDLLGRQPSLTPEHVAFLRQAADDYAQFAAEVGDDPETRFRAASAHWRTGSIYQRLGDYTKAEEAYIAAEHMLTDLGRRHPNNLEYERTLAAVQSDLGGMFIQFGKLDRADSVLREARILLDRLLQSRPDDLAAARARANTLTRIGLVCDHLGRRDESEQAYREAIASWKSIVEHTADDPGPAMNLATNYDNLATLLAPQGRDHEAEVAFTEALTIRRRLAERDPGNATRQDDLGATYNNLGLLLGKTGRLDDAERSLKSAAEAWEKLVEAYPSVSNYNTRLGAAYSNLGFVLGNAGRREEAVNWITRAIAVLEAAAKRAPGDLACRFQLRNAYWGRGYQLDELGKSANADPDWQRAVELDDSPIRMVSGVLRAESFIRKGKTAEALRLADAFRKGGPTDGEVLYRLARIYALAARGPQADARVATAMTLLRQSLPSGFLSFPAISERLRKDVAFESLRSTTEFSKLLADVDARQRR